MENVCQGEGDGRGEGRGEEVGEVGGQGWSGIRLEWNKVGVDQGRVDEGARGRGVTTETTGGPH